MAALSNGPGGVVRYAAVSAVGNVRQENQDAVVVGRTLSTGPTDVLLEGGFESTPEGTLVAVIDGMGGHRGGREASALVARYLLDRAGLHTGTTATSAADDAGAVLELLTACNVLIHKEMTRRPELRAMGATIAGLACLPASTVVFNVGDARAYYYDGTYLQRSFEEHRAPSGRLVQSLGGTTERVALAPFAETVPRVPGARWLLCSDGLSDSVPFLDIQAAMGAADPAAVVRGLLAAAMGAGGNDNVSIVLVET